MNSSHKTILVSICLLLVVGGTTLALINRWQTIDIDTRALASANTQTALRGQIARLRMEMSPQTQRSTQADDAPAQKTARRTALDPKSLRDHIAHDPALIELRKNFFAADAKLGLERGLQFLGLSDDQITAVCDRAARFNEQAENLANQLPTNISGADDPRLAEYRNLSQQARGAYESDLKALLGNGGFEKLAEFQSHQETWQRTDSLAGALYASETPLSNIQSQELFEVMKTHATYSHGSARANYDIPAIVRASADFLSPLQLSVLNKQLIAAKIW